MDLYLTRTLTGLAASDDAGREILRRIKVGSVVKAEIVRPRNLRHHRQFFALLNLVWSSAGDWPSVEDLLIELKLKLGITRDVIIRESGEVVKVLGSISFANMDQSQFDAFYERAVTALCDIAGGIDGEALRAEVLQQLAAA